MEAFVGIDLGTTFSVVAWINPAGQPEVIADDTGNVLTPSVISFGPDGPVVGAEAKELQADGEHDVASFFKRLMGDPNYQVEYGGTSYSPVGLSALVLKHLVAVAQKRIGRPVRKAVITVPAYFDNLQREATIQAGREAGLEVLSIISEPTAAAWAYGVRPTTHPQTVLVYDLGGGTFDVSVVRISDAENVVLGTEGDHQLGGKDWDDRIYRHVAERFEAEFGEELPDEAMNEMLVKAENAKKSLSARANVDVSVRLRDRSGSYRISREQFEVMTEDLVQRTERMTNQLLDDIKLNWGDIDNVLLVGGSTRMPMVRQALHRLSGKAPLATINPDEAVALGAAIQAAEDVQAAGGQSGYALVGRRKSIDAIGHSLGMIAVNEDATGYTNSIIIRKNLPIPATFTKPYKLRINRSGQIRAEVYMTQGEVVAPLSCKYLGKYVLTGSCPGSGGEAVLDVTYSYDRNGVVQVSAVDRASRQPLTVSVEPLPEDVPARFGLPPAAESVREHLTVYLAFDVSGSMSGDPLRAAKKAAHAFINNCDISTTSVGLISFSDRVHVDAKACQNVKEIERAINELECGRTGCCNGTDPFDELRKRLSGQKGRRFAIVLADGVWEHQREAVRKARQCHEQGIEVVGVGFGGADTAFLREISTSDENSIFTDLSHLEETFSSIAQEITEGKSRSLIQK
jgi:molecular chaperone DnaK (HSP70)